MERELSFPNCSPSVNIVQFISLVPNTPTNPFCPIYLISCLTLLAQLTMQKHNHQSFTSTPESRRKKVYLLFNHINQGFDIVSCDKYIISWKRTDRYTPTQNRERDMNCPRYITSLLLSLPTTASCISVTGYRCRSLFEDRLHVAKK